MSAGTRSRQIQRSIGSCPEARKWRRALPDVRHSDREHGKRATHGRDRPARNFQNRPGFAWRGSSAARARQRNRPSSARASAAATSASRTSSTRSARQASSPRMCLADADVMRSPVNTWMPAASPGRRRTCRRRHPAGPGARRSTAPLPCARAPRAAARRRWHRSFATSWSRRSARRHDTGTAAVRRCERWTASTVGVVRRTMCRRASPARRIDVVRCGTQPSTTASASTSIR